MKGRPRYRRGQTQPTARAGEQQILLPGQRQTKAHRTHHKTRSHRDFHDLKNTVLSWFSILLKQSYLSSSPGARESTGIDARCPRVRYRPGVVLTCVSYYQSTLPGLARFADPD